jgi:hypothetical protein
MNVEIPQSLGTVRDERNIPIVSHLELGGDGQPTELICKLLDGVYRLTQTEPGHVIWRAGPTHAMQSAWLQFTPGEHTFTFAGFWWQYNKFEAHDGCQFTLTRVEAPAEQPKPREPVKPVTPSGFRAWWRSL